MLKISLKDLKDIASKTYSEEGEGGLKDIKGRRTVRMGEVFYFLPRRNQVNHGDLDEGLYFRKIGEDEWKLMEDSRLITNEEREMKDETYTENQLRKGKHCFRIPTHGNKEIFYVLEYKVDCGNRRIYADLIFEDNGKNGWRVNDSNREMISRLEWFNVISVPSLPRPLLLNPYVQSHHGGL